MFFSASNTLRAVLGLAAATAVLSCASPRPAVCTSCASSASATAPTTQPAGSGIRWEPYSEEAFVRAKKENKLIILDLHAVWCHWCHVQDDITYNDPKVIQLINDHFVAISVDQDSRPDISNLYGDYGWPATILYNPNGEVIAKLSGYIPPRPMASRLAAFVHDPTPGFFPKEEKIEFGRASSLTPELEKQLRDKLDAIYDSKLGGWGSIHKFVDWDAVEDCLKRARTGDKAEKEEAEHRARQTLDAGLKLMDPAWGGVYQYSVGGDWNKPHYEKLMQFQAEMMRIYVLASAQFNDPNYLQASAGIRGYIADFLTSPDGAFYVSQDADLIQGQESEQYRALDNAARRKLGVPHVDNHCYARETGWGIHGLLSYYAHTQNPADLAAAIKAAQWAITNRTLADGGFRHDASDAAGPYLGDTLSMGQAFLDLYEVTADRAWISRAESASDFINAHFHAADADAKSSAGYITAAAASDARLKPGPDHDENVAAARYFNLLYQYAGRKQDKDSADEAMRYLSTPKIALAETLGASGILLANTELRGDPLHITILGKKNDLAASTLFMEVLKASTGYSRIEWWDQSTGPLPRADVEYPEWPTAAAFICTGNACSSPMTDPAKVAAKLGIR